MMVEIARETGTIDFVTPSSSVAVCIIPSRLIDRNEVMSTRESLLCSNIQGLACQHHAGIQHRKPTHRSWPKVRALAIPNDICFVCRGVLVTNVAILHAFAEEGVNGWLASTTCIRYAR